MRYLIVSLTICLIQATEVKAQGVFPAPVCTENSNPDVMMVKAAEDRV
jgi:hypothetical protein